MSAQPPATSAGLDSSETPHGPRDEVAAVPASEPPDAPGETVAAPVRRRVGWFDVLAALSMIAGALWVTARGWRDLDGRLLGSRPGDVSFNEWMIANAAHAVRHLENPYFSHLQNAPDGVNLMTNIGMQVPGILLSPLTWAFGAAFSYLFLITLNLAATAFAWYWVLSRHVVTSGWAALLGGLFCAFAPALVSHSNGHPHITAQWLVPFIVWRVVRLTRPGRSVRDGLILGALIAAQFLISVEVLLLIAVGCAIATVVYAVARPREALRAAPNALRTLALAGGITLAVAAYPLWMMFLGPQSRVGHPGDPDVYALKMHAFVTFATRTLAGRPNGTRGLIANTTEEASFYGWPLALLAVVIVVVLWRHLAVRVLAVVALVAAVFSIGTTLTWGTERTDVPAPFMLLEHVPPFDAIVIARFALITTAALGVLLALAADRLAVARPAGRDTVVRYVAIGALLAALIPLVPTPLEPKTRPVVPDFVTSGAWREFVAPERTLVPVPIENYKSIRWGAAAQAEFAVPQGYFLVPTSPTDKTGRWFVEPRPTSALLTAVGAGKRPTTVTEAERAQALADARFWKADAFVLNAHPREADLRAVLDAFFGPGRRVDDVWVWDVRGRTG